MNWNVYQIKGNVEIVWKFVELLGVGGCFWYVEGASETDTQDI